MTTSQTQNRDIVTDGWVPGFEPQAIDTGLLKAVRRHWAEVPVSQRARLADALWADLFSEFDARLLSAHLRAVGTRFDAPFWAAHERWARDEAWNNG